MIGKGSNEVTVCYLILAHDNINQLQALIDKILSEDENGEIVVHFDLASQKEDFTKLLERNENQNRCHFLSNRVECYWGGFGIVQATLIALSYAISLPSAPDYFYLLSGTCFPLRSLNDLKKYLLRNNGKDFIECSGPEWIQGGIKEDRYLYHHFLNSRKYKKLFRFSYKFQKKLKLKRKLPQGINFVFFGSQWWCLTTRTVKELLNVTSSKPSIVNFFKSVWVPDECFFQTIYCNFINSSSFSGKSLTYSKFDEYGCPMTYNVQKISCINIDGKFFVRKISHNF